MRRFLSHTHFTFYCCTPVNLLKPSLTLFSHRPRGVVLALSLSMSLFYFPCILSRLCCRKAALSFTISRHVCVFAFNSCKGQAVQTPPMRAPPSAISVRPAACTASAASPPPPQLCKSVLQLQRQPCCALQQPARTHTLLPLAPSAACVVEPAHMDAECRNSRLRNVLLTPPCLRVAHLAGEAEEVDT